MGVKCDIDFLAQVTLPLPLCLFKALGVFQPNRDLKQGTGTELLQMQMQLQLQLQVQVQIQILVPNSV